MVAVEKEGDRLGIDVVVVKPPADSLQLFLAVVDGDADAVVGPLGLQPTNNVHLIACTHVVSELRTLRE